MIDQPPPPASRDDAERLKSIRQQFAFINGNTTITGIAANVHELLDIIDARDASLAVANAELDAARAEIARLRDDTVVLYKEIARLRSAAPSGDLRAENSARVPTPQGTARRDFKNEIGNDIGIFVFASEARKGNCRIQMRGPHSNMSNIITRMELEQLYAAIGEALILSTPARGEGEAR